MEHIIDELIYKYSSIHYISEIEYELFLVYCVNNEVEISSDKLETIKNVKDFKIKKNGNPILS